jgi:hypothetical protein
MPNHRFVADALDASCLGGRLAGWRAAQPERSASVVHPGQVGSIISL